MRTRRHMPHWNADGATYFVTFRLADAIPVKAAQAMEARRLQWLSTQGISNGDSSLLSTHELRFEYRKRFGREFHEALDNGLGECLLGYAETLEMMTAVFRHFDGDRYELGDFVTMPNHVHVLLVPLAPHSLSEILHSWKSFSSNKINRMRGQSGTIWQSENYDHIVRTWEELGRIRRYIRANPQKAGLRDSQVRYHEADWDQP